MTGSAKSTDTIKPAETIGFGTHRLPRYALASHEERLARNRTMLVRALNSETTVAVVGSGCSIPLGYPSWREFTKEVVDNTLKTLASIKPLKENNYTEHLQRFQNSLRPDSKSYVESKLLMFYIGVCQKIHQELTQSSSQQNHYYRYLQERFNPSHSSAKSSAFPDNPYHALLKLPIHRFITTNYDCEIERALEQERDIPPEEFAIGATYGEVHGKLPLSFTQDLRYSDQLALFALSSTQRNQNMVFHCHGRFDAPETIIASEDDYQRWYLAEQSGGQVFQRTIELLMGSNPLLFVGYGLGDEDLLRPLRHLGALNPKHKHSRSLFVLMENRGRPEDWDHYEYLYDRYGINVVLYDAPVKDAKRTLQQENNARAKALCEALHELKNHWQQKRFDWLHKPVFRHASVNIQRPNPYHYFSVAHPDSLKALKISEPARQELNELKAYVQDDARVLVIVGPPGSGKTWHTHNLLKELTQKTNTNNSDIAGYFYWNAHFSDDPMTALDRMVNYFDPDQNFSGSRLQRLADCLKNNRYLLVIDGFERLLCAENFPDEGASYLMAVEEFLNFIVCPYNRSTVVLASCLWPTELDEAQQRYPDKIIRYPLRHLDTDNIASVGPFQDCENSLVSALCSLLDGHTYGITLAYHFLRRNAPKNKDDKVEKFRRRLVSLNQALAASPPDRRMNAMIKELLDELDEETKKLSSAFLARLTAFITPIDIATAKTCYDQALSTLTTVQSAGKLKDPESLLSLLVKNGLLSEIIVGDPEESSRFYAVHLSVRLYLSELDQDSDGNVLPRFGLPGMASAKTGITPFPADFSRVEKIYDKLCDATEEELESANGSAALERIRRLYGLMRARFDPTAMPENGVYDEYIQRAIRLLHLCKQASPGFWTYRNRQELQQLEAPNGVLYPSEQAWLYNAIGLLFTAEGSAADAYTFWEQSYEINRVLEGRGGSDDIGDYDLQALLNLCFCFIQRGRLQAATDYLGKAKRLHGQSYNKDFRARIKGLNGLIAHLQGNLEEADRYYHDAIKGLRAYRYNPRGESIFLRHRANLKRHLGDPQRAQKFLRASRTLAQAGNHFDLLLHIRLSEAHLARSEADPISARVEYSSILAKAKERGIRELEVVASLALAELTREQGDAADACRLATYALSIANELGQVLRQTDCLIELGKATREDGQHALGVAYLRHALQLANEQQFWLRSRSIERYLRRFGNGEAHV